MKVVIAGPRDRRELVYRPLVNILIDDCKDKYSKLLIVTKSCDQGVGKIIRTRCIDEHSGKPEFDMCEISLRHHLVQELTQSEFQSNFDVLNLALVGLGDEFHLIMGDSPKGSMYDLLKRVQEAGRPHSVYNPEDFHGGIKQPELHFTAGTSR